ncbi:MAG: helix-hairpin-helix domain-containing protein [Candidatus Omnitrophica bacterium]|nr:helix-hairpin-helix domain-containing protein [Candidatus Omnitrophota bacterium]
MRHETRDREQRAAAWLGALVLLGFALVAWQRRHQSVRPADAREGAGWDARLAAARRVDINTAGVAELERLPGVGRALAARIVEERRRHGPFASPESLQRVSGIGPKTIEALREYAAVGTP